MKINTGTISDELKGKLAPVLEEAIVEGFFGILLDDNLISNEEYENCMKDCDKISKDPNSRE